MSARNWSDRFVENQEREKAWTGIARKVYTDATVPTLSEAAADADCLYKVEKVPRVIQYGDYTIPTKHFDIIRTPFGNEPPAYFGTASARWEPVQNETLVGMFEPLAKYYPVETMGALDDGKIFFFTLKGGNFDVKSNGKNDPCSLYTFIIDYKTTGKALIVGSGATRIVCWNTLMAALRHNRWKVEITHTLGSNELTNIMAQALTKVASTQKAVLDAFQMMASQRISMKEAEKAFEVAFPMPTTPSLLSGMQFAYADDADAQIANMKDIVSKAELSEEMSARVTNSEEGYQNDIERATYLRETARISLDHMTDAEGLDVSKWTVMNAISETLEHRTDKVRGQVARDVLFGKRSADMQRATTWLEALRPEPELVVAGVDVAAPTAPKAKRAYKPRQPKASNN